MTTTEGTEGRMNRTCESVRDAVIAGETDWTARGHLATCSGCARLAAQLGEVDRVAALLLSPIPPDLLGRVHARVSDEWRRLLQLPTSVAPPSIRQSGCMRREQLRKTTIDQGRIGQGRQADKVVPPDTDMVLRPDVALPIASQRRTVRLAGNWYALWETTAEGKLSIDSESVMVQQRGTNLIVENRNTAPENPLGSFLWRAQCRIYDNRYVLGSYVPRRGNVRSKGVFYLSLHTSGAFMLGGWLGCNYDDEIAFGFSVFARDPAIARTQMAKHVPSAVSVMAAL
jgi:hypothetical protein